MRPAPAYALTLGPPPGAGTLRLDAVPEMEQIKIEPQAEPSTCGPGVKRQSRPVHAASDGSE